MENLLQQLKEKETRIQNLENYVVTLTERVGELKDYIVQHHNRIAGDIVIFHKFDEESDPVRLRDAINSLHQRLNMLESGSPSDN